MTAMEYRSAGGMSELNVEAVPVGLISHADNESFQERMAKHLPAQFAGEREKNMG
jgi:hypothetical protein